MLWPLVKTGKGIMHVHWKIEEGFWGTIERDVAKRKEPAEKEVEDSESGT